MTIDLIKPIHKIKVLFTGGVIGMHSSSTGLTPYPDFLKIVNDHLHDHPSNSIPVWTYQDVLPLNDSSSMTPEYWLILRRAIINAVDVDECAGVLVLHGTDTLAYTAAAMSFQLKGIPIPVIFTGAMIPTGLPDSDVWENLIGGIVMLGNGLPSGVHLYFHGELLDPLLSTKLKTSGRHPFGQRFNVLNDCELLPQLKNFNYRTHLCSAQVAIAALIPGQGYSVLISMLRSGVDALILEHEGPELLVDESRDLVLLETLRNSHLEGVVIVAVSRGVMEQSHIVGATLRKVGVISGGNFTREAVLGKLHTLMGAKLNGGG